MNPKKVFRCLNEILGAIGVPGVYRGLQVSTNVNRNPQESTGGPQVFKEVLMGT